VLVAKRAGPARISARDPIRFLMRAVARRELHQKPSDLPLPAPGGASLPLWLPRRRPWKSTLGLPGSSSEGAWGLCDPLNPTP